MQDIPLSIYNIYWRLHMMANYKTKHLYSSLLNTFFIFLALPSLLCTSLQIISGKVRYSSGAL